MHTFVSCLMHVVFSTKERRPWIKAEWQSRLWSYLGGIARDNQIKLLKAGGVADHIHLLLSLPSTVTISQAVQRLKGNSSKWIHETFARCQSFEWQKGYGAFSLGISSLDDTVAYIENQAEHHRRRSFREELEGILKKHSIKFEGWMLD